MISIVAVVLAMSGWAVAARQGSSDGGTIHGCVVKHGEGKGLLRIVKGSKCPRGMRPIAFNREGPVGPRGARGEAGPTGPVGPAGPPGASPTLPPLEAVHFVGTPNEPPFEEGSSNSSSEARAGFWKDRSGVVHLQGTVNAGVGDDVFRLPQGFQAPDQVCFSVPGFTAAIVYKTNRLCVIEGTGEVRNVDGEGVTFISLDGIEFRTD